MAFIAEGLTAGVNPQNRDIAPTTLDPTGAKAVPEKIKFYIRIVASRFPFLQ